MDVLTILDLAAANPTILRMLADYLHEHGDGPMILSVLRHALRLDRSDLPDLSRLPLRVQKAIHRAVTTKAAGAVRYRHDLPPHPGILTWSEICQLDAEFLSLMPNFGATSLRILREYLARHGLALVGESPDPSTWTEVF